MPFDLLERSLDLGRPEELYEFSVAGTTWRYTSSSRPRTLLGQTYTPIARLRRTAMKQSKDGGDDSMKITIPYDHELAAQFKIIVPARRMDVRILKRHRGDGDEFAISWIGRVRGCGWQGGETATLECDGYNSMFKRAGLRLNYGPLCPHMVYGPGCNVDRDQFRVDGTVISSTRDTITCAAFASKPSGWFRLGYVEFGLYFYMISHHVGDTVTVFSGIEVDSANPPLTVTAYAGCDNTIDTCWDTFNNGLNSEANAWHPNKNPFETGV